MYPFRAPNAEIATPALTQYFAPSPQIMTAASANGVTLCFSAAAGIIPMMLIVLKIYTTVAMKVPKVVALATVAAEFATLPEGMVAHSIPRKAKNVSVVVAVMAVKEELPLELKGKKLFHWI